MDKKTRRTIKEIIGGIAEVGVLIGAGLLTVGVRGGNTIAGKSELVLDDIEKWIKKD